MRRCHLIELLFAFSSSSLCCLCHNIQRRSWLVHGSRTTSFFLASLHPVHSQALEVVPPPKASSTGLLLLPPVAPLRNEYYVVRAAESIAEAAGAIESNAATKMSVQKNSLTPHGISKAESIPFTTIDNNPLVYFSTARSSAQSAEIIARRVGTTRERLIPEFLLLDARGFGAHEGERLSRLDELHTLYDAQSRYLRPPEGSDGAYAESVDDVYVRVRQFMSKLETIHFGEQIILVTPGNDVASILVAAIQGLDLRQHWNQQLQYPVALHTLPVSTKRITQDPGVEWANDEHDRLQAKRTDLEALASDYQRALWYKWQRPPTPSSIVDEADVVSQPHPRIGAVLVGSALAATAMLSLRSPPSQRLEPVRVVDTVPIRQEEPPEWLGPCPPGDDACLAVYINQDDQVWLRNINAILHEDSADDTN